MAISQVEAAGRRGTDLGQRRQAGRGCTPRSSAGLRIGFSRAGPGASRSSGGRQSGGPIEAGEAAGLVAGSTVSQPLSARCRVACECNNAILVRACSGGAAEARFIGLYQPTASLEAGLATYPPARAAAIAIWCTDPRHGRRRWPYRLAVPRWPSWTGGGSPEARRCHPPMWAPSVPRSATSPAARRAGDERDAIQEMIQS